MTQRQARALFARERDRFARLFPRVANARLELLDAPCIEGRTCRRRDLAVAYGRGVVVLLARALALPRANIVGLMRHELGHLADPWLGDPGGEQRADDIAELVTGERIFYDRGLVQTVGTGRYPRPRNLHA